MARVERGRGRVLDKIIEGARLDNEVLWATLVQHWLSIHKKRSLSLGETNDYISQHPLQLHAILANGRRAKAIDHREGSKASGLIPRCLEPQDRGSTSH